MKGAAIKTISLIAAMSLVVLASVVAAHPVFADGAYHSEHVALDPAAGFPLRSGFVENIHANGPTIFALENYVLNGAQPNTSFTVVFFVHPACGCDAVALLPTGSVSTNEAGNGHSQAVMAPEAIPPEVRNRPIGGHWELWRADGTVAYSTRCTTIVLD